MNAIFRLAYRRSVILYTKKVSATARIPINSRGTKKIISMECVSELEDDCEVGYPYRPRLAARKICPKYG
jgi:hypothetical protein